MKLLRKNALGPALRCARSAQGVSQEDFGAVSSRTYVSQLERGERHATLSKVDDLSEVLGLHPATVAALAYLPHPPDLAAIERLLATIRAELTSISTAGHA
ncbi:helix-turn-helix domain-containing protein [Roseateles puraquae]|uniref:Transcriptional regulator n=1 Tax=Roseateles puraquae TaxID=431059 RepID=A0A254NBG3_9BURK|nr:helix-turn-helix transcriptional regulator [Roseateles puraquae]MDG0857254.1 XRE family transcriptional regulator [Roseateles puraquae]OWR02503.1 transcriptional regulator [Roseateles puraquae]